MFNIFKKKEKEIDDKLYSPVSGEMISIEDVPDKVFNSKMMGDGVGFRYDDAEVVAPCDGTLTMIANTKHAFGITMENGAEVLIHIGLDTVEFQGEGFEILTPQGSKVKKGTPIIRIDHDFMKEKGVDLTTPLVITNTASYDITPLKEIGKVALGEAIFELKQK